MASGDGFAWFIIIVTLLFGIIAIVFLLNWLRSHRLRVRDPMNKAAYVRDYWMLEKKDKHTGVVEWVSVLWQRKIKTPVPPDKSIDVGNRGRKYVEAYRLSEDEFVWITDKGLKLKKVKNEKTGKIEFKVVDKLKDGKVKEVDTFKPFSATQREVLVSQMKKAEEIGKKGWTTDKVIQLASFSLLAIVIIIGIIFAGDIAHVIKQGGDTTMGIQQETLKLIQAAKNIGGELEIAQTPSAQEKGGITQPTEDPPT